MLWEEANTLMSKTHPSIGYFVQIEIALQRPEDKLHQLFAWLVARRIKQLPAYVGDEFGMTSAR